MYGIILGLQTIKYLYENNIVNGKTESLFAPKENVTREEFVKMLIAATKITGPDFNGLMI